MDQDKWDLVIVVVAVAAEDTGMLDMSMAPVGLCDVGRKKSSGRTFLARPWSISRSVVVRTQTC